MLKLTPQILYSPSTERSWAVRWTKKKLHSEVLELMKTWATYLNPLPRRSYSVSGECIYLGVKTSEIPKQIDIAKTEEIEAAWKDEGFKPKNNLYRELTALLKWQKDDFIASDPKIKHFAKLLLRIAWDPKIRAYIKTNVLTHPAYNSVFLSPSQITPKLEAEHQEVYQKCIDWLQLNDSELTLLESVSWDWKSTYSHCPYSCKLWLIIWAIIKMINLDKE